MDIFLSLIIPVYNGGPFIADSLLRLTAWRKTRTYTVEVILVNDGSTDNTLSVIQNYIDTTDPEIGLISGDHNRGKGYAVRTGMMQARGKYRIFTDADIPFGVEVFDRVIHCLDFKGFDVCIGNRHSVNSEYRVRIGWLRGLSSQLFTFFISRFVVTGITDTQCGLKGFKGSVAEKLFGRARVNGFAFDVELLYLCYKYEFEIRRIPVKFEGNNLSTIRLGADSVAMFTDVIGLPIRYHFTRHYWSPDAVRKMLPADPEK